MRLSETHVRAIVRLVGEVAVQPGPVAEKKRFLMEGLCKLIGADSWVWGLSCQRDPDKPQVYVSVTRGGLGDEQFARVLQAIEHPQMMAATESFFSEVNAKQQHLTRLRQNILPNLEEFRQTEASRAWEKADVGPVIFSLRPLDERSGSTIAIYRRFSRPEFSACEARIAHIVLTELPWLHEIGWPEDRGRTVPQLTPRQRIALNLLSTGQGCKQIADQMNVSTHTAQGYIKEIYRHFGVHSQAELMNRFYQGNGFDVA